VEPGENFAPPHANPERVVLIGSICSPSGFGFSPGFTWGYSHSTPLGLGLLELSPQVSPGAIISLRSLLRFTFNPFGVGEVGLVFPQVSPGAIHIQPLWGWGFSNFLPRFHLGLFTFNPFGVGEVGSIFSPGFTWGYSHSTPLGLGLLELSPQVSPGAIHIQPLWGWDFSNFLPRFHLGLFTFNPFGVGTSQTFSPGFTWGYSHSTPLGLGRWVWFFPRFHLGLFKFNPYRGWGELIISGKIEMPPPA